MTDSIDLRNISNLQQIAETIQKWLQKNDDWKTRFEKYATTLKDKTTENHIKTIRKSFHKVKNLNLYTSIGDINSGKGINLRYDEGYDSAQAKGWHRLCRSMIGSRMMKL